MKIAAVLLITLISTNSLALTCISEKNPEKTLNLKHASNGLVTGSSFLKTNINLFVGKKESLLFKGDTYTLFNQSGTLYTFFMDNSPVVSHCRALVCDSFPSSKSTGKLFSEGIDDEYFTCL